MVNGDSAVLLDKNTNVLPDSGLSFPRNFVFQEMGYNAPVNWKEKRS